MGKASPSLPTTKPPSVRCQPQQAQPWQRLTEWCELIKVEHTVLALPFALSGLILAEQNWPTLGTLLWTILAFASARTAAMSLNRAIDADIDRINPRTAGRAIPKGRIKKGSAFLLAIFSFIFMILAATQLPRLCLTLAPIAVLWLSLYSFSKRFTPLCHVCLGIALGGAALGGWIANGGNLHTLAPWMLAAAVTTWVAGFDIIYACLDFDFDVRERILSIPARFGLAAALRISATLHVLTISFLICLGALLKLGLFYWVGIAITTLMLSIEHRLVSATDLSKVNAAFFTVNGLVSILIFVFILLDKLWPL